MKIFKNVIQDEMNETKRITYYKDSGFFHDRNLNKSIMELKSKLAVKEKVYSNDEFNKTDRFHYESKTKTNFKIRSPNKGMKRTFSISNNSNSTNYSYLKTLNSFRKSNKSSSTIKINKNSPSKISINKQNSILNNNTNNIKSTKNINSFKSKVKNKLTLVDQIKFLLEKEDDGYNPNKTPPFKEYAGKETNKFSNNSVISAINLELENQILNSQKINNLSQNSSIQFNYDNSSVQNQILMNPEKVDFTYKTIFDKKFKYEFLLKQKMKNRKIKSIARQPENDDGYIEDKITKIKNKVFFMKGIFDYSYPKIMTGRYGKLAKKLDNDEEDFKIKEMEIRNEKWKDITKKVNQSMTINTFKNKTYRNNDPSCNNSVINPPPKFKFASTSRDFLKKKDYMPKKTNSVDFKMLNLLNVKSLEN